MCARACVRASSCKVIAQPFWMYNSAEGAMRDSCDRHNWDPRVFRMTLEKGLRAGPTLMLWLRSVTHLWSHNFGMTETHTTLTLLIRKNMRNPHNFTISNQKSLKDPHNFDTVDQKSLRDPHIFDTVDQKSLRDPLNSDTWSDPHNLAT